MNMIRDRLTGWRFPWIYCVECGDATDLPAWRNDTPDRPHCPDCFRVMFDAA